MEKAAAAGASALNPWNKGLPPLLPLQQQQSSGDGEWGATPVAGNFIRAETL